MRRKHLRIAIALMLIVLRYLGPDIEYVSTPVNKVAGRIVVIDPGHGGIDPGALSKSGVKEKDLVLAISKKLEKILNSYAIYTVMTRETDTDLAPDVKGPLIHRKREDLNRRASVAKNHKADLLVSIHANSFPEPYWSGAQTFYNSENGASKLLAETIQSSLVNSLGPNKRKAKPGDFRILRESKVPSAMIEVGFLSNPKEANLLQDSKYQDRVAEAIAKGIIKFFESGGASSVSAVPPNPLIFVKPTLKTDEIVIFYASLKENGVLDYEKRTVKSKDPQEVLKLLSTGPVNTDELASLLDDVKLSYLGKSEDIAYVTLELGEESGLVGHLEALAVYSIVNTLTLLPGIEEVVVEVVSSSEEFDWSGPLKFNNFYITDEESTLVSSN